MRRTHSSFPADGEIWTAVCFGKITSNPAVTSEHHIDLHLERKRSYGPEFKPKSDFRTAKVGLGALPGTALGTQWVNGRIVGDHPALQTRTGVIHFPEGAPRYFGAYHRDETDQPLIPAFVSPIPGEAAQSPYVVLRGSVDFGDKVIIPCSEVARAWFLRTTNLALALTSDPIERAISNILDPDLPQKPGENPFCLREGFSDADATVAALLRYSSLFKSRATELSNSLVAGRVNGVATFLTAYPPLFGEQRVKVLGFPIRSKGQNNFLVVRLLSIPLPAFDVSLGSIVRYLRAGFELGEDGDAVGGLMHGYRYVSPRNADPDDGLGSSREPNKSKPPRFLDPTLAEFENAPTFNVFTPPPVVLTSGAGPASDSEPPTEYSTGAGVSSGTIGAVRFRRKGDSAEACETERMMSPAMPATFDNVEAVIPILTSRGCKVYTISNTDRTEGLASTVRYQMPRGTSNKNWVFVGDHLRQMLVLEIDHRGWFYYLLDIQRRPESTESYTLFFVTKRVASQPQKTRLSHEEVEKLVLDSCVEKEGRWAADPDIFVGAKLKHSHSTAEQLGEKLQVKMREFQRRSAEELPSPHQDEQLAG